LTTNFRINPVEPITLKPYTAGPGRNRFKLMEA
jgi:hypothetical protein